MEKTNDADKISALEQEIADLKKQLALEKQKKSAQKFIASSNPHSNEKWQAKITLASYFQEPSFFKAFILLIKKSYLFKAWQKTITFFRRFRLLTYLSYAISYIITLVGTGAVFLVYVSASAFLLTGSALFFLTFLLIASSEIKKMNALLVQELAHRDLFVFFTEKKRPLLKKSFFMKNALDFSSFENSSVIIVASSLFLFKNRTMTATRIKDNIFVFRKYYYYSFKKHVLPKISGNITIVF